MSHLKSIVLSFFNFIVQWGSTFWALVPQSVHYFAYFGLGLFSAFLVDAAEQWLLRAPRFPLRATLLLSFLALVAGDFFLLPHQGWAANRVPGAVTLTGLLGGLVILRKNPFLILSGKKAVALFGPLFGLCVGASLLSPITSLVEGNPVIYMNAFDEYHYLSWDMAQGGLRLLRASQGLVKASHMVGLSGGLINFLWDLTLPIVMACFLTAGLRRWGLGLPQAFAYGVLGLSAVTFFSPVFPLWQSLENFLIKSELARWVTLPMYTFPSFWRTPEPQFSFTLLSFVFFLVTRHQAWSVWAALPLLYFFTAYPLFFAAFSLFAWSLLKNKTRYAGPLAMLLGVAAALFFATIYRVFAMPEGMKAALMPSRLPLLPLTGVLAVALLKMAWPRLGEAKWPVAFLAFSPFVAANHQVFSGILTQPNNFEDAFGVLVCVILFLVNLHFAWSWARGLVLMLAAAAFSVSSGLWYHRHNQVVINRNTAFDAILRDLKTGRAQPLVNDLERNSYLALALPKTPAPQFSISALPGWPLKNASLLRYACARWFVKDSAQAAEFKQTLDWLDNLAIYEAGDYFAIHLFRRKTHPRLHTIPENPAHCPKVRYKLYVLPK